MSGRGRFLSVTDAQEILNRWKDDYNNERPHSSLQDLTPAYFGVTSGA